MATTTTRRRAGRIAITSLGAAATAGAFSSGVANAGPIADGLQFLDDTAKDVADRAAEVLPPAPEAPKLPPAPDLLGMIPSNLLRTGGREGANVEGAATVPDVIVPVDETVPGPSQEAINDSIERYNERVVAANEAVQELLDPENIGQAVGALNLDPGTIGNFVDAGKTVIDSVTSGKIIQDIQTVIEGIGETEEYRAWRNNEANPFNPNRLGADGISDAIDAFTTNPVAFLEQTLIEAGGPINILTDPLGAFNDVVSGIAGPDFLGDVWNTVNEQILPDLGEALAQAAPALLLIPAGAALGALIGTPLGALNGAPIGALLGALNPLNLLGAIPGALIGAPLGALATGIPGFIASLLMTLPLFGILPLAGAAGASALALAAAATIIFGTWLGLAIPIGALGFIPGIGFGIASSLVAFFASGANPAFFPSVIANFFLGLAVGVVGLPLAYLGLTILVPVIVFALVFLPLLVGSAMLGSLLGFLAAGLAAAIGIPLITALSAIPGAIIGSITGALAGVTVATLLDMAIGATLGALIGGGLGALIGSLLGGALGTAVGVPLFIALASTIFGDKASAWGDGPLGRVMDALNEGWENSKLKQLLDRLGEEWAGTETGSALNDLGAFANSIAAITTFLDGRRLRNLLLRGAIPGALLGAIPGAITGGILGTILGALNPLNLLNGLTWGLAFAIPGGLIGATIGSLISDLISPLAGLASLPFTFLPNLIALSALWAIPAIVSTLAALAATIVPPIAIALASWVFLSLLVTSPIWLPAGIGAGIFNVIAGLSINPIVSLLFPPILALAPIAGGIASILVIVTAVVVAGALLIGFPLVAIPAFFLSIPFFVFPALSVPLLWLISWPLLLPIAAGLSVLEAIGISAIANGLLKLLTIPVGALTGALAAGLPATLVGTLLSSLIRTILYGTVGTAAGTTIGAGIGGALGALAALLSSLRVGAGKMGPTTFWAEGKIVPNDFLDSLPLPVGKTRVEAPAQPVSRTAVPVTADPYFMANSSSDTDRQLSDVSALAV